MVNKKDFASVKKGIERMDSKRDDLIRKSTGFIRKTKIVINSIHCGNMAEAGRLKKEMETEFNNIKKDINKSQALHYTGIYKVIVQEYVEAMTYYHFTVSGKLLENKQLEVNPEYYLLGLCDLTGEMVRKAVNAAITRDYGMVMKVKDFVSELYGEFLKVNLRGGELRKKFDEIKYSLKKLEDLVMTISLKNA